MRLYEDPASPFLFYDFSYGGKRYRGTTGEKTQRAAMMAATTSGISSLLETRPPDVPHKPPHSRSLQRISWSGGDPSWC
jgi:hypothetical protein